MSRNIILLEFNELCPSLLDQWMGEGLLPNFTRFYRGSQVFTAIADETNPDHLDPWIQWYSIHTGIGYSRHGVFHLTDGPTAGHRDVWQMLMENGRRVFNCSSMNAKGFQSAGSFFLPDPWCTTQEPYPKEFSIFYRFVASNVRDNSMRGSAPFSRADTLRFLLFMARNGLRPSTVGAIVRQLWSDTILRQKTWWKRAVLLDKLQFDLFEHYWRRQQPDFSTFFINSTAHYQHAYWHCLFPEQFPASQVAPIENYKDAILFGYQQMDKLLGRCFELENKGAMLILATALSQHANKRADRIYYRPQAQALLSSLGIVPEKLLPVMADSFSAHFSSEAEAKSARAKLAALRCAGQPAIGFGPSSADAVYFASGVRTQIDRDARIEGLPDNPRFLDLFYALPHTKSGTHHPDSVLWFKDGTHKVHADKVSILDILPTILDYFGMHAELADARNSFEGHSLLPHMGLKTLPADAGQLAAVQS